MLRFKNAFIALLFATGTALLLWSNVHWVKKGGILDNAVQNEDDPFLKEDRHVRAVFNGGEPVYLVKQLAVADTAEGISAELAAINRFHEKLRSSPKLSGIAILSAANTLCHRHESKGMVAVCTDTQNVLYRVSATSGRVGNIDSFDRYIWREALSESAYGKLLNDGLTNPANIMAPVTGGYALFILYPPVNADETMLFRSIVEVLEEREIPAWEWFVKSDLYPADRSILVAGWVMGRGLIDGALNSDVLKTITIGIALATVLFYVFLRSALQAVFCSLVLVLISILWTRGMIGLLDVAGFPIRERVYVLLAYTNCIVQGVSFGLHLFAAYNATGSWEKARQATGPLLAVTSVVSIVGFATLWSFEVLAIRELGVISALGVASLYFLSSHVVPVLYVAKPVRPEYATDGTGRPFIASSLSASLLLFVPIVVAGCLFALGALSVKSTPGNYVKGTLVDRAATFLAGYGKPGFDSLELFVERAEGTSRIEQLRKTIEFARNLKDATHVREVFGVPLVLGDLATSILRKNAPETEGELKLLLAKLEGFDPQVRAALENGEGYRLSVSSTAENSLTMQELRSAVAAKRADYPELRVSLFGKTALYPSIDEYIVLGKPLNALTSQVSIIVLIGLWIWWRKRAAVAASLSPLAGGIVLSVPFLFASAAIMAVMMLFGVPLDAATAPIGAIAINASIDFAIYFANTFQKLIGEGVAKAEAMAKSLTEEGGIILKDMALNMCCFAPLLSSPFEPVRNLGFLMIVTLAFAAIGTLVILPPFLLRCVVIKGPSP